MKLSTLLGALQLLAHWPAVAQDNLGSSRRQSLQGT